MPILLTSLILFLLTPLPGMASDTQDAAYAGGGTQTCLACHTQGPGPAVAGIFGTPHGQLGDARTPLAGEHGCETCHGPSAAHIRQPGDVRPPVRFGPEGDDVANPDTQNGVCLGCHQKDHVNWQGSTHDAEGVTCTSCHKIHDRDDPVRDHATQAETCFGCHLDKRTQANLPFRHAIREGDVACSSCHDPHGGKGPSMLARHSVNDTCYTCHAEKRGPFLVEHEPVQDDCTHCHAPHGSVNERMLKVRPPFLCQQCHVASRHIGTLYDSGRLASRNNRLIGNACANCHSQVHGSNHPAGNTFRR